MTKLSWHAYSSDQRRIQETYTNWRMFGIESRRLCLYYWFSDWGCISLGVHFWVGGNIEIHLPFGFVRVGLRSDYQ